MGLSPRTEVTSYSGRKGVPRSALPRYFGGATTTTLPKSEQMLSSSAKNPVTLKQILKLLYKVIPYCAMLA